MIENSNIEVINGFLGQRILIEKNAEIVIKNHKANKLVFQGISFKKT